MSNLSAFIETLPLRADVHVASCSDGVVFLDVARDTYLSLHAPHPRDGADHSDDGVDRGSLEALLSEAGLLDGRRMSADRSLPYVPRIWRTLPRNCGSRPPLAIVSAYGVALLQASLLFRTRRFADMLAWASTRSPRIRPVSEEELVRLVGWFEQLCLWLPVRPLCLFRSHLLLHFLRRLGFDADWVFGVTLFPFHAHCWLAVGDILIGERSDRVEEFTTIFSTEGRGT